MAATAAVAAASLGGAVRYWGRLGSDDTGHELQRELESHGVEVRTKIFPGTLTPTAAVLVAASGERMLTVFPGRLDDSAHWLPLDEVGSAQAVHADFRWPLGARTLYEAAIAKRIPRVLDADVGSAATVRELLPLADHAIFSQQGLAELSGSDDPEVGLRKVAALNNGVAGVTLGERGSVFLVAGVLHRISAPALSARDTNGAGDVFHGAYTLALAEGSSVIEAARFATIAAALKSANGSGWDAVPDRASVDDYLRKYSW